MTVSEAIENIPIIKNASYAVRDTVLRCAKTITIKENDFLFHENDEVNSIYFIVDGFVVLCRHDHKGNRKNIFLYGKGAVLNEEVLDKTIATVTCQALSDCCFLAVRRNDILGMLDDHDFAKSIVFEETYKIRRLYRQLANTTSRKNVEVQVASKIWRLAGDFGEEVPEGIRIKFRVTVTFLADMVGAQRETTSRIVNSFKKAGLIEVKNGFLIIKDMQGIRDAVHKKK